MKYKLKKELTREDLIDTKWRVDTPEKSKTLQLIAFGFGFHWSSQVKRVLYKERDFLYVGNDNYLGTGSTVNSFKWSNKKEMKFDDWFEEDREYRGYQVYSIIKDEAMKIAKEDNNIIELFLAENCELVHSDKNKETYIKYNHPKGTFMWAVEQELEHEIFRKSKPNKFLRENKFGELDMVYQEGAKNHTGLTKDDINATDWEIFEENKFGNLIVDENGNILCKIKGNCLIRNDEFDDLEKAIKFARELQ